MAIRYKCDFCGKNDLSDNNVDKFIIRIEKVTGNNPLKFSKEYHICNECLDKIEDKDYIMVWIRQKIT